MHPAITDSLKQLGELLIAQLSSNIPPSCAEYATHYAAGTSIVAVTWNTDGWAFVVRHREQKGPVIENAPVATFRYSSRGVFHDPASVFGDTQTVVAVTNRLIQGLMSGEGDLVSRTEFEAAFRKEFVQGWFAAFFPLNDAVPGKYFKKVLVNITPEHSPHQHQIYTLDFASFSERQIGVYLGDRWVGTIKFNENGVHATMKPTDKLTDNDVNRLLAAFVASTNFRFKEPNNVG